MISITLSTQVTEIVNHPSYEASTNKNDVAIIKVSGSFTCEQGKLWPACLPSTNVSRPRIIRYLSCKNNFVRKENIQCYCCRNTRMRAGRTQWPLAGARPPSGAPSPTRCSWSRYRPSRTPPATPRLPTTAAWMPTP